MTMEKRQLKLIPVLKAADNMFFHALVATSTKAHFKGLAMLCVYEFNALKVTCCPIWTKLFYKVKDLGKDSSVV